MTEAALLDAWATQKHRHALLQRRERRGAPPLRPSSSSNRQHNVVRSDLQALYERGRRQPRRHCADTKDNVTPQVV
ncbi:hypothetical protein HAP94_21530 [Acidithiobacillus ferrivorans]|nr:hypothetical protein [Acidithiobacillus ferrivorans]